MNRELDVTLSPASTVTSSGRQHIAFLDGARGLAALYVCISHVWVFHQDHPLSMPERVLRFLTGGGHSAVNVFIVLSGYCLMLPFMSGQQVDIKKFLLMRTFRIVPPYVLCLVISAALGLTIFSATSHSSWDASLPVTATSFLAHLFLVHDWFGTTSSRVNYVFWSIGVEWKIYFLFPLLVLIGRRFGFMKLAVSSYLIMFAIWMVLYEHDWLNPVAAGSSVYYVGLFAAGMATAVWVDLARKSKVRVNLKLVFVGMAITTAGVIEAEFKHAALMQIGAFFGGILACLWIVWLSFVTTSFTRLVLSSRAVVALGAVSYSLYLVHPLALQIVWVYAIKQRSAFALPTVALDYALSVGLSLAFAYAFYRIIEAPAIGWTRWAKNRGRGIVPVGAG